MPSCRHEPLVKPRQPRASQCACITSRELCFSVCSLDLGFQLIKKIMQQAAAKLGVYSKGNAAPSWQAIIHMLEHSRCPVLIADSAGTVTAASTSLMRRGGFSWPSPPSTHGCPFTRVPESGGAPVCESQRTEGQERRGPGGHQSLPRPLCGVEPEPEQETDDPTGSLAHGEQGIQRPKSSRIDSARNVARASYGGQVIQFCLRDWK